MTPRFTIRQRHKLQANLTDSSMSLSPNPPRASCSTTPRGLGLLELCALKRSGNTAHDCTNDPAELTSADARVLELTARLQLMHRRW